ESGFSHTGWPDQQRCRRETQSVAQHLVELGDSGIESAMLTFGNTVKAAQAFQSRENPNTRIGNSESVLAINKTAAAKFVNLNKPQYPVVILLHGNLQPAIGHGVFRA